MGTISLIEAYHDDLERELSKLKKIDDPLERRYSMSSLFYINKTFFLHSFFCDKNLEQSKNFLYKAAMCEVCFIDISRLNVYDVLNTFTFPVISDSSEVINKYLSYPFEGMDYHPESFGTLFSQAIQASLRNDDEILELLASKIIKDSKRGWQKYYAGAGIAFKGLAMRNKEMIEQGILELLETHNRQNPNTIDSKYINYEATAIAKLAYRKEIKVQIDNPLVPIELLPIKELDKYEGYDFFMS